MPPNPEFRFWHLADIDFDAQDVGFRGKSGRRLSDCQCRLMTQSGHDALAYSGVYQIGVV